MSRYAEQMQQLASVEAENCSITSSAGASSIGGTTRPNALAALTLMTSSYLSAPALPEPYPDARDLSARKSVRFGIRYRDHLSTSRLRLPTRDNPCLYRRLVEHEG